jgi:mRNA-degrading endonuclease RelE of RelBE toxin-antitoxin system
MTYSLEFDVRALKEWQKLGDTVRQQLKKKLAEVLLKIRALKPTVSIRCRIATRSSCAAAATAWCIR